MMMKNSEIYTWSELEAMRLVGYPYVKDKNPHDAGNEIILLAEKIKADRAILGMN